ncbi:MAG: aldehyde dehydrogenase family protein [Pusillimonas sp.]
MTAIVQPFIDGQFQAGAAGFTTLNPYSKEVHAEVVDCDAALVHAAVAAAHERRKQAARVPGFERAAMLRRMAGSIRAHATEIAAVMTAETGKPVSDSLMEVERSAGTLELSAEEAIRIAGEQIPLDSSANGAHKIGLTLRVPVGVVAAITPFNAPLNLCSHKIGPALAAGNTVVLKPAPQASATVHRYVQALAEAGIPPGWLNVIYGFSAGEALVNDLRVNFISFTGSTAIGERIKQGSGLRRAALELGGNGNTIVCHDADVQQAARECARNSMRLAGQSCISVQNVWVHEALVPSFKSVLINEVQAMRLGDPRDPATVVGPVISTAAAERIEGLVAQARRAGATVLHGDARQGALYTPTVLMDTPLDCVAVTGEIFGPVVNILPFSSLNGVVEQINEGPFGLQAGVFTVSIRTAISLVRDLEMGGVIVNGTSTWRSDQAPYGGIKASGMGREGPKYAIRDMTEEKFVLFNI